MVERGRGSTPSTSRLLRLGVAVAGALYPYIVWALLRRVEIPLLPAFQLVPAALSLLVGVRFARTLRPGAVPQIEQFARVMDADELPDRVIPWLRQVTIAWVAWLGINAIVCGALALTAPVSWWALWTGGVTYAGIGALIAGEYVLRKIRFRWYRDGVADRLWARAFPPRRDA